MSEEELENMYKKIVEAREEKETEFVIDKEYFANILNYINKLQQKNKQLKDKIEKLKDYGEAVGERRNQLYDKIDQAIEYIARTGYYDETHNYTVDGDRLLEILGEKENE